MLYSIEINSKCMASLNVFLNKNMINLCIGTSLKTQALNISENKNINKPLLYSYHHDHCPTVLPLSPTQRC